MKSLGIDVGGSGIKGAPVDLEIGELIADRHRIVTPQPATPEAVGATIKTLVDHFEWDGPIGCGLPAAVQHGVTRTAANIDSAWLDLDADALLTEVTGCPAHLVNDADAAGLAEMHYGVGRDRMGVVIMVTIGTGLGTALFNDGVLVPNTELGHLEIDGEDAETRASGSARKREELSWKEWTPRFERYLRTLENLFWPDLFIIGGGASKKSDKFFPLMDLRTEIIAARLRNEAGIVGAALAAREAGLVS